MPRDNLGLAIHEVALPEGFVFSTDPERVSRETVYAFLASSYWAHSRPREIIDRSLEHSLLAGIYFEEQQVAFARVVTDGATFAYLCDVFVAEECRGFGLGQALIDQLLQHPELPTLRRWILATRDAHGLYERFGFEPLLLPERWMERIPCEGT